MASIVLYYTLGGTTRKEAEARAEREGAAICEVTELRKRNLFTAFLPGCPHAMRRKPSKIAPIQAELPCYDRFILCFPVWAGFPAPACNAVLDLLPEGSEIALVLCSSGGETPKTKQDTIEYIKRRGFTLLSYEDVCTAPRPPQP